MSSLSVAALLATALALLAALVAWRRSLFAKVAAIRRSMRKFAPTQMLEIIDRKVAGLPPWRRKALLERLAARLERDDEGPLTHLAQSFRQAAEVFDLLRSANDAAARKAIADFLEAQAAGMQEIARKVERGPFIPFDLAVMRACAEQARLFAALLRAESLGHLSALRSGLEALVERVGPLPPSSFFSPGFLGDLRDLLEALEQIGRLPSTEDRALSLGQALTQSLKAQERQAQRIATEPSYAQLLGGAVLETLRQLLANAVHGIRQHVEIQAELCSRVLLAGREAALVLEVKNAGQGHARHVSAWLEAADDRCRVLDPRRGVRSLLRHQSARLEFLVEPRGLGRAGLLFRISYTDPEHRRQRMQLAAAVEVREASASRPFKVLAPNPYVVGRPLGEGDVFIGRAKTLDRITSNLRGSHQDNVVILIGQWRMGKTSILRRLPACLGHDYVPVLIDLQGVHGAGEEVFFRELVASIHDELAEAGVRVAEPAARDFALDPATVFRRRFLRDVQEALGERRLLVMFDEFEVIEERIRSGGLRPQILPFLRSLVQHEQKVSFMFAGTHRLDELTGDYWSALFNLAVYLDVGHLRRRHVEKLFTEPTAGTFDVDPLALEKVYQVTGGHPHFSQLLARELVEYRNRERLSYVTVRDVNVVADSLVAKSQVHLTRLWDQMPRGERLLLLAVKDLLDREGLATTKAAHRYLSEQGIEPEDLPAAARRLERQEMLADNAGQLTYRMDLLRRWLHRNHDLKMEALLPR